ncbi:MAG: PH domain-containing protein [Nitrososphaerota archaeon]|nr:PH domain-containing protein [Nitrososphaerota archaeon]MDG7023948.1 PH domain-containing protein [Nitrososphaerota archaeon]
MVYEGGVWWKRKSFVPYNRVTNIDVIQGPVSRHFGFGRVTWPTCGFPRPSSKTRWRQRPPPDSDASESRYESAP